VKNYNARATLNCWWLSVKNCGTMLLLLQLCTTGCTFIRLRTPHTYCSGVWIAYSITCLETTLSLTTKTKQKDAATSWKQFNALVYQPDHWHSSLSYLPHSYMMCNMKEYPMSSSHNSQCATTNEAFSSKTRYRYLLSCCCCYQNQWIYGALYSLRPRRGIHSDHYW